MGDTLQDLIECCFAEGMNVVFQKKGNFYYITVYGNSFSCRCYVTPEEFRDTQLLKKTIKQCLEQEKIN